MRVLSRKQLEYLKKARVGRLATIDRKNGIHLVPIVFANLGDRIYFVVDRKTKSGRDLQRIRNISDTGKAVLLIDRYSENWKSLSFLLIHCFGRVLTTGSDSFEKRRAAKKLKEKYPQYSGGPYFPKDLGEAIFVRLEPERAVFWQNLH
jgi:PPOX class probable F420-dependent enzyme